MRMPRVLATVLLLFYSCISLCQDIPCKQWPAPCPDATQLKLCRDWNARKRDNINIVQELEMEDRLRNKVTNDMLRIGRSNGWDVYELTESSYDRPDVTYFYPTWEATPYEKRPPHIYQISFVFIVKRDSLNAWRNWYRNEYIPAAKQAGNQYISSRSTEENDPKLKMYLDSAMYYTQLRTKYMLDHQEQYVKDLKANNEKGLKAYEQGMEKFQKKTDEFSAKYQAEQQSVYSGAVRSVKDLDKWKLEKTNTFSEESLVLVNVNFNMYQAYFGFDDTNKSFTSYRPFPLEQATAAMLIYNKAPLDKLSYTLETVGNYTFINPSCKGVILLGGWTRHPETYSRYEATYKSVKGETDMSTNKAVKCDVVQNVAIYVEGKSGYVTTLMKSIDLKNLKE